MKKTKLSMLGVLFTALALVGCKETEQPADDNNTPAEVPADNPADVPAEVDEEVDEITNITFDKHYASLFYSTNRTKNSTTFSSIPNAIIYNAYILWASSQKYMMRPISASSRNAEFSISRRRV